LQESENDSRTSGVEILWKPDPAQGFDATREILSRCFRRIEKAGTILTLVTSSYSFRLVSPIRKKLQKSRMEYDVGVLATLLNDHLKMETHRPTGTANRFEIFVDSLAL